ncbi:hypothetical protein SS1G_09941 [Sclerotinia sclerotiorum 1980 UF-70]|uniref:HTH CENPB-type domain-containing protein n=2 Tax=Sclerotinia sclerotiorum (strain ATCC 18683 / 1980 / Ss-1) TaxID=665079 RepID=A7EX81_SCLS1|nr:hypothetical protein SS1G_09941 [Sclerotinia sclerotiorum 1980 UF-70]APA05500.1 hypothetical protein sscle_01g002700 [Sclerotinia sclerotiorum 1980 UF-70]EDN94073.1 hypothetical protein SS1G_09941 [Sclerotinia sclerotiorum 1980 UF-70]
MHTESPLTPSQIEEKIQNAIIALQLKDFKSIRKAAEYFEVPKSTLIVRVAGRKSRTQSHEMAQILSNAEENTLVRWISQLTIIGFLATPILVKEMADEIRLRRVQVASSRIPTSTEIPPIGHEWIYRFQKRYLELKTCYSHQLESNRAKVATPENIQAWFDAFRTCLIERKYELDDIYNMDETGFGVGNTQSICIIVDSTQKSNWKVIAGKQEWITAFECVNTAGKALSPMIIFKAQNTNSAWIPKDTPQSWQFSTSTNGWTSNSHGLEWLKRVFEPESKKVSGDRPRLLIMDGHSSHITGSFIAFCIEKEIDLLILPPYCSHLLQPLDIAVNSPPDGTELRQANQTFNKALADNDSLASPTRRYAKRMTRLVESQNAEIALLRKQLADAQEVIETRKKRTKGKRVKLQGQFVFSSEEVLKMVREAEEKPKEKKPQGRPRKRPIEELEEETEEEEPESSSSDLELELDECVARRTRSHREN